LNKNSTKSAKSPKKKKERILQTKSTIVTKRTFNYTQVKTFFFHSFGDKKTPYNDDIVNDWLFHNRDHIKEIHDITFDIQEGVTIVTIWYTQTLTIKTGRVILKEDALQRTGKD
jgi:hypothetical protein